METTIVIQPTVAHEYQADRIKKRFAQEIGRAQNEQRELSFLVFQAMHHAQAYALGKLLQRKLTRVYSATEHVVRDGIVRNAEQNKYYLVVDANREGLEFLATRLQHSFDAHNLRVAAGVMQMPPHGDAASRASYVYDCLENGLARHDDCKAVIYTKEFSSAKP